MKRFVLETSDIYLGMQSELSIKTHVRCVPHALPNYRYIREELLRVKLRNLAPGFILLLKQGKFISSSGTYDRRVYSNTLCHDGL